MCVVSLHLCCSRCPPLTPASHLITIAGTWFSHNYSYASVGGATGHTVVLASYPGSFEGAEKRAWSTLSAHAFKSLAFPRLRDIFVHVCVMYTLNDVEFPVYANS